MSVGISGPFYTLDPGDEFHFPDDEAARLVEAGFAVAVTPVIETATVDTSGNEKRRGRQRKQEDVVSADGDSGAGE
ncbi:hypothetical protein [Bosea sp. AS-1]|uniref:hypothetical protein n=1 Tax=Bosea sp. AS-1 TaxID=2015316 RepID=UPI0012FDFC7C|nr:hypothetical protein [Bosea sp. AS-1]